MAVAEVTVKQLAQVVGVSVEHLLDQLSEAGLNIKDENQPISEEQKHLLLDFLRKNKGSKATAKKTATAQSGSQQKITLRRKEVTQLSGSAAAGKKKTVNIEVRKKRTYVKPTQNEELPPEEIEEETLIAQQPVAEASDAEHAVTEVQETAEAVDTSAKETTAETDEKVVGEASSEAEGVEKEETPEEKAEKEAQLTAAEKDKKAKGKGHGHGHHHGKEASEEDDDEKRKSDAKKGKEAKTVKEKINKKAIFEALDETEDEEETDRPVKVYVQPQVVHSRPQLKSKLLKKQGSFSKPVQPQTYEVVIPETITVAELAKRMSLKAAQVVKVLINMGVMATINESIEQDTAVLVVEELGHKARLTSESELEEKVIQEVQSQAFDAVSRAPVVTIMGHVDHGKTSLLDYIRRAKVAAGEAGGITQHIGAYHVSTDNGNITFIDTPGHEAFTAMRARGAKSTDIVILVVAADDGVKPQTIEAIQHAKAGNVPLIVAVNKMDKPEADPDKVKNELSQYEVIAEEWGGDTQFVPISALTGDGIDNLLDAILVQAEMLELKARGEGSAEGVVLESRLDKGRGPVTTVLVQQGALKRGDILLAGTVFGKVRAMLNESGQNLKEAGPSIPVEVLGLTDVPNAGDEVLVVDSERKAREVAEFRVEKLKQAKQDRQQKASLENLFSSLGENEKKEVPILLKADVQGSIEAIVDALNKISNDEVSVKVISSGVGGITESDINLAMASNAIVFGFNVRADSAAKKLVERESIDLHYYSVIYDIVDQVKQALSGMLSPEIREEIVGIAQVRDVFKSPKFGAVAGCMVTEGTVKRTNPIRVLRENVVIYEGVLESLRRFKDDVNEVRQGYECGIAVKNYNDVKPGDQIEVYERIEVKRVIE